MKKSLIGRLPVQPQFTEIDYSREPTSGEIRMGYGCRHYKTFTIEECCHKGTRITKRWLKCPHDGLRYYHR